VKIDFKKELEIASKGMIMIHDPKLLIKLIIRMIVRKLGFKHAAMILYEPERDAYVLSISRGEKGVKIPEGFTRFSHESPLIELFCKKEYKHLTLNRNAILSDDINRLIWKESVIENGNGGEIKELLHKVNEQMEMLNSVACVPAYYRQKLMAILLLGEKHDDSKFEQEELDFFVAIASDVAMAIRNAQLFTRLKTESDRNRTLFLQTINVLGSTIEAKDPYTHGHTTRVTDFSVAIARQMVKNSSARLTKSFFENLYIAGLDVNKLIVNTVDILNSKFIDQKIKVNKQFIPNGYLLNIDPNQIKQALLNILLNSIEAMPNGGELSISTSVTSTSYFVIKIEDTGSGIPKEDLSRIFDPFFSKRDNGTGLGLSITQGLIENHKGIIQIKSKVGSGTSVKIDLPY